MRKLFLILLHLQISLLLAFAQEGPPVIESVDVSGVEQNRVAPELRERMQELVGRKFDQLAADEVAFELQNRLGERVAAIRQTPGSRPDLIKVVFEVGGAKPGEERDSNVNSRYTVEDVELRGVADSAVSSPLREDMRKLVGEKLDDDIAGGIEQRLQRELSPAHSVARRVVRGADRGHVRLIYEVTRAPLLRFRRLDNYVVAHSKESVSFGFEGGFTHRNSRLELALVNDGDALLERYAGYQLTLENINAGTEHLGFRISYFSYHDKWKAATRSALQSAGVIPGIYRERRGIEPTMTFAVDRRFRASAGFSVSELQMQDPAVRLQNANVGTASVAFEDTWRDSSSSRHRLEVSYLVRSASHVLDSDFIYTRHLADFRYSFRSRHNEFVASAKVGAITGRAPLYERFSLGNTTTLRGWNKYDLEPAGGDRVAHGSLEYRLSVLQIYYEAGSVWDGGGSRQTSHAAGFGLHGRGDDGGWFFTMGVPVRAGRIQPFKPVFMLGARF